MILEVAPPHYWAVRNEDALPHRQKRSFIWAIDPGTKKPVSDAQRIDLKLGDTDRSTPFNWVRDLQRDLWDFGYRSVLANKSNGNLPATPVPDGTFDVRCQRAVRRFQIHARLSERLCEGVGVCVQPTYSGAVTGVVDDATKREIEVWISKGYTRVLQPFDPEGVLIKQRQAGLLCPAFFELLALDYVTACDREDLEPYGACAASMDPDGYRERFPYWTWHLAGLGCDMNFYSTKAEAKPWYHPVARPGKSAGEYDEWPRWEHLRAWQVARDVGLAIAEPPSKDPRHVEYHPQLPHRSDPSRWTSVPDDVRKHLKKEGGNSPADLAAVWALAVDPPRGDFPPPPPDVAVT